MSRPLTQHQKRHQAQAAAAVVGVDAGKFHHVLVVRPRGQPDSRPLQVPTTRPGFEQAVAFIRAQLGPDALGGILVGIEFAGMYGFTFAHFLRAADARFRIVSILPAHTKRWKEVTHRQPLKTDAKDAVGITDLAAQGHFVSFPFLAPAYAELRHLLSAREKLSTLRRGVITRLRTTLDVVFPEFPALFASPVKKTARALLREFPGPEALRTAPKRTVLAILKRESRNHLGRETYERLLDVLGAMVALNSDRVNFRDLAVAARPERRSRSTSARRRNRSSSTSTRRGPRRRGRAPARGVQPPRHRRGPAVPFARS